ncbi:hypothetical protein D3273_25795 [Lichenibacterium minor]|uniref:Uncharacterized protein n=1 Tax=Lichenibacterium minor TaxID=2316528 RepID=A0A4Q2TYA5_9HYPH|nr:hypothetical protein [Lichenibacterium minor]RYC29092.1 hypothetical protein D3273_25795 [Lichenibacterium minor]
MSSFAIRPAVQPLYIAFDALPADSAWGREMRLDAARFNLADARTALAAAVKAQDPDRHFRGLPECPWVIEAYDAVRAAEAEVVRLEREGKTP